jgi:putative effector of murein hydrolase
MSFLEMQILMVIGLILTVMFFTIGLKYKKKWLKRFAVVPFLVATFPLLYLFLIFGIH